MFKLIPGALGLLLVGTVSAQQFQHAYGTPQTDMLIDVTNLSSGGFMVAGFSNGGPFAGTSGLIMKLDDLGNVDWSKSVGGAGMDNLSDILEGTDGRLWIGGSTSTGTNGAPSALVGQLEPDGTPLWFRTLGTNGEEQLRKMAFAANGDILLTGLSRSVDASYDIFVARLNGEGDLLWNAVYGSNEYEVPLGITEGLDGSIYVWAHQDGESTQGYDALLVKLDANGELLLSKRYAMGLNELAWDILTLPNGDLLLSGDTNSSGAGMNDAFVMRTDSDGNILWSKTFGAQSNEHGINLVHTKNNDYALVGASSSFGQGGLDFMVLHFNDAGGVKYVQAYGGEIKEVAHGVVRTPDSGLLMVGESRSYGPGLMNGFAVRVDQDGRNACNTGTASNFQTLEAEMSVFTGNIAWKGNNMVLLTAEGISVAESPAAIEAVCSTAAPEIGSNPESDSFENAEVAERMRLRPNPSNGTQVRAEIVVNEDQIGRIEVFNLAGRKIAEELVGGAGMREVVLPPLARGIYLVRYTNGLSMDTQKLIIE